MLLGSLLALAAPSLQDAEAARGTLVQLSDGGLKFELFLPTKWRHSAASANRWPVLVFLHGAGESGGFEVTNAQSLPWQLVAGNNASFAASCGFIVLVPQCPQACADANHWLSPTLRSVASLVHEWVQPTLGGDPHRTYLAGQSMGGHGAWLFAAQQPRLFAAVVVVCGYAQGGPEQAEVSSRLVRQGVAVHVYHSADDSVIPVAASDDMVEALRRQAKHQDKQQDRSPTAAHAAAAKRLEYTRYLTAPGPPMPEFAHLTGHGSYEIAFRDASLYSWLLQHECTRCKEKPLAAWRPLGKDQGARPRGAGVSPY